MAKPEAEEPLTQYLCKDGYLQRSFDPVKGVLSLLARLAWELKQIPATVLNTISISFFQRNLFQLSIATLYLLSLN